ncbi:General transcription factor IIE subunit 1 [Eumeta japonica]|uniref:General transcription factor IIE subunit 1 n=1 Tax=Eumeta variegata TaxID=151549 RepID=A0A4C1YF07_EUMVA|nr:General transcription factor IIE subunit 1 [Eumeta japonica]
MTEERLVTEVPSSLKQLARLVVRGFYTIEDALIVDMLVRNPCMKEDDICELLKFERKMLRARIALLKNDKFIQKQLLTYSSDFGAARLDPCELRTVVPYTYTLSERSAELHGPDGKAQKVNYYFINYKTFVNVVKYKLDLMRKRMETEERDATSRASFKCPGCGKTFTDLEADHLYDMLSQEFLCTFCNQVVEEDQSALPKKDSRLLLAKFNEQLEPLYILLREVEGIKLAPEILEPEPVDINTIRGLTNKQAIPRPGGEQWSGEATRNQGLAVEETRVDVTIGENDNANEATLRKERPVWMSDSVHSTDVALEKAATNATGAKPTGKEKNDDIMSVLLAHEKQNTGNPLTNAVKGIEPDSSDSSDNESKDPFKLKDELAAVAEMDSEDSESDDNAPTVQVNGRAVPLTSVDDDVIAQMTPAEKETYIQLYQEYYSHMYD